MKSIIQLVLAFTALSSTLACADEKKPYSPAFFAFQNGLGFESYDKEAEVLKELGYAGVSQVFQGGAALTKKVEVFDKYQLEVKSIYLNVNDKAMPPHVFDAFKDRNSLVDLTIMKASEATVAAVRETVETAAAMNIKVALYPHHGFAVSTIADALEMVKKVNHPNLGITFNLCHFLKGEDEKELEKTLEQMGDKLFAVSISGADIGAKNWDKLILPLNQGDFPQIRVLKQLKKMNFTGPVELQCHGIKGDKYENLKVSMDTWKKLLGEL